MACRTMQLIEEFVSIPAQLQRSPAGSRYGVKGERSKTYLGNQETILMRNLGRKGDLLQFFSILMYYMEDKFY